MSAHPSAPASATPADYRVEPRDTVRALERDVVRRVTRAPLRMSGTFELDAPKPVLFERVSDPEAMATWFPLLKGGELDHDASRAPGAWGEGSRRTCRTNGMGTLHERIHHWDAPHAYAYEVRNFMMPIEHHLALMATFDRPDGGSTLVWHQYFDLTGIAMRHAFPSVMLNLMNVGMKRLASDLGGVGGRMRLVR